MKSQIKSFSSIFMLILIGFILAGCQSAATETIVAPSPTVESSATETATLEPQSPEIGSVEPPGASLQIDDKTQESGIGTYCWPGISGNVAVCVDKIGIPTDQEALEAGVDLTAVFNLPLDEIPSTLVLTVKQVTEADQVDSSADGFRWWQPLGGEQHLLPLNAKPQIELNLDEGLYLFSLFAQWPNTGDVTYGFLVEAKLAEGAGIPVKETTVKEVVTLQDNTILYSGPGKQYDQVDQVFSGLVLPVRGISEDDGWWQLDCTDDSGAVVPQCWVSADSQVTVNIETLTDEITAKPTRVKNALILAIFGINMRSAPEVESEIITIVPLGNLMDVTGTSNDGEWWRVRCQDGTTGNCWISSDPKLSLPTQITKFSVEGLVLQPVEEQFELWIVSRDRQPALIAEGFQGTVSADGKQGLRCCLSRETLDTLTLVDFETGRETTLVEATGFLVQTPHWLLTDPAETSEKVFFLSKPLNSTRQPTGPGLGYLTVVNVDGSGYEILDSENNTHAAASISPDGKTIAYTRGDDTRFDTELFTPWLYNLESGAEPFDYTSYGLEELPDLSFGSAAWSPDGSKLAWMIAGELAGNGVWGLGIAVFDLDAQSVEIINPYAPTDAFPARVNAFEGPTWSPDSAWLTWGGFPVDVLPGFWVLDIDGNIQVYVENATQPHWSPDSRLLAFNIANTSLVMETGSWEIQHSGIPAGSVVIGWVQSGE